MHRTEIEEVRAHLTHIKEQVKHVREEHETTGEQKAAGERAELDAALAEASEADRELSALEDLETAEAEHQYHADPTAARMAAFFLAAMDEPGFR